jgi:hypothetical protein
MVLKFSYKTQQEREKIFADNPDLILIEEQNIVNGNFLFLSDIPKSELPGYINIDDLVNIV